MGRHGVYKAETELAEARHQALSIAVLAQVHLAVNRYGIALKKYEDASELEEVSGNLAAMLQRDKKREGTADYGRIRVVGSLVPSAHVGPFGVTAMVYVKAQIHLFPSILIVAES